MQSVAKNLYRTDSEQITPLYVDVNGRLEPILPARIWSCKPTVPAREYGLNSLFDYTPNIGDESGDALLRVGFKYIYIDI